MEESNPKSPSTSLPSGSSTILSQTLTSKDSDVYEFKTGSKDLPPSSPESASKKSEEESTNKRPPGATESSVEEDSKRRKTKKEENSSNLNSGSTSSGKSNSRASSIEKAIPKGSKGSRPSSVGPSFAIGESSAGMSPKKPEAEENNEEESAKRSSGESGTSLKVPPLKIVLSNNGGNGSPPNGSVEQFSGSRNSENQQPSSRYVVEEQQSTGNEHYPFNEEASQNNNSLEESDRTSSGPSRVTRSKAVQGSDSGGEHSNPATTEPSSNSNETTDKESSKSTSNNSSSNLDYSFKKRKLRSQVDDCSSNNSTAKTNFNMNAGMNGNNATTGNGTTAGNNGYLSEPMNDIEKYLNIRKQVEQRRKNLFPVQPKPPQGFKDYLMNRKTYLLQQNANERLRQIPMIKPPPSLEGAMVELFEEQEEARYKLRMKHVVEKEKLVLSVEQEILRVHGRAARALANQSLPYSVCTILKDEEIYTPIDPQQEEKNRDIRSRYNGRLFLSWLQDVDDKWERIKEQMVLRHHNEAESLNAVQKMDWEWKLKEISGSPTFINDSIKPQIDDLLIPMVHVSDDFDLMDCRN